MVSRTMVTIFVMHLVYTAASASENSTSAAELRKWRAVITKIERTLTKGPNSCEPGTIRAVPIDAAQFEGSSFALVDVCPLGAYTELIDVMRFDANQPVLARSRRDGHQVAIGFSRGASVMHGKDVKLVPEKHAIYDISWDNDGMDSEGTAHLEKCAVDAYVWSAKARVFDYDPELTHQATRDYCQTLGQRSSRRMPSQNNGT